MDLSWLIAEPEPYEEYDLGPLKTGKEAEVFLVERIAADGRSCLLALKRYRPRKVTHKGELEALGFQRSAAFVNDRAYRDGRAMRNTRDRRAAAKKTKRGREVLGRAWPDTEFTTLSRLAAAGVRVPWPVARTGDGLLMQYLGDHTMAAPRLADARLDRVGVRRAASLLVENLHAMVGAGIVHADLSVYNLLWWDDTLWVIDVPQSVEIAANTQAFELLRRDLDNVATWFQRHGADFDADAIFTDLLSAQVSGRA